MAPASAKIRQVEGESELEALMRRLRDLDYRLSCALANPEVRPGWLHWSDLACLGEARDLLMAQDTTLAHLRAAVAESLVGLMFAR